MCGKVLCVYAASGFLYDVREIEEARNVGLTCLRTLLRVASDSNEEAYLTGKRQARHLPLAVDALKAENTSRPTSVFSFTHVFISESYGVGCHGKVCGICAASVPVSVFLGSL